MKSLSLGVVINVCLTLLYGLAVGFVVNETLSSRTILMLAFTAVVLSLACFVLRLWVSPLVAWNVVAFFIVAGLTVSSGMFEDAPMLYAVIPTTWVLNGVKFAGYVIPVGVVIARDKRMSAVQGGETCLTEAVYGCTVSDRNRPAASFLTVFRCGSEPAAFR